MKQVNRFVSRFGRPERTFTEAQIMKFIKHRDDDSPGSLVLSDANSPLDTTLIDPVMTAEPEPQPALARGAWA